MSLRPTSNLVAVAWLKSLTWPAPTPTVTTALPLVGDWPNGVYISVAVVGGALNRYVPLRHPVVQVDCWTAGGTTKERWRSSGALAERVLAATYGPPVTVSLPTGYDGARIHSVEALTEPRRIHDEPGSVARFTFDIELTYVSTGAFSL